ncbi:unnamed protein product, partial [Nesidiocoris tenuis]
MYQNKYEIFENTLPLTETFRYFRVMHFGVVLSDFPSLKPRPNHESVHGSLYVLFAFCTVGRRVHVLAARAASHLLLMQAVRRHRMMAVHQL